MAFRYVSLVSNGHFKVEVGNSFIKSHFHQKHSEFQLWTLDQIASHNLLPRWAEIG